MAGAKTRIALLGSQDLTAPDGTRVAISNKKALGLIAYLALCPGMAASREKIVGLLWGDRDIEHAQNSLRQTLTGLRRELAQRGLDILEIDRERVALRPETITVDTLELEGATGSPDAKDWERAVDLCRGPFLEGFFIRAEAFEAWSRGERERLHELAIGAHERLAQVRIGSARVECARRLVALDSTRENSHVVLIAALVAAGQPDQATRQFEACREMLAREFGAKPSQRTIAIRDAIATCGAMPGAPVAHDAPVEPGHPQMQPEKPSIAVLPFSNMSGEAGQQYFSDGMTEEIITELSRSRSLLVIARHSSFQYRDTDLDVRRVGLELGVQFVVEGAVRKVGERVRVTAQLIDAATGNHLWAERYDRDLSDVLTVQDEIARSVAATIGGRVEAVARDRAARLETHELRAYDLVLRARAHVLEFNSVDNALAKELLLRAIEADPASARAHALYGHCRFFDFMADWVADREASLPEAREFTQRALMLDDSDSLVHAARGMVQLHSGEYESAGFHFARALELNPYDPDARARLGYYLCCIGEAERAIEEFASARRQNPFDLSWVPWVEGIAYFTARRYGEAIATLAKVNFTLNEVRFWQAASFAQAGRTDEARARLDEYLRVARADMANYPGDQLGDWAGRIGALVAYRNQRDIDHLLEALAKAGMPE